MVFNYIAKVMKKELVHKAVVHNFVNFVKPKSVIRP